MAIRYETIKGTEPAKPAAKAVPAPREKDDAPSPDTDALPFAKPTPKDKKRKGPR